MEVKMENTFLAKTIPVYSQSDSYRYIPILPEAPTYSIIETKMLVSSNCTKFRFRNIVVAKIYVKIIKLLPFSQHKWQLFRAATHVCFCITHSFSRKYTKLSCHQISLYNGLLCFTCCFFERKTIFVNIRETFRQYFKEICCNFLHFNMQFSRKQETF